ncbi:MAG: cation:dicarboxylase symporter family transporter [Candidatus Melainabacteria bacterium]|nr:cation:dicarboxylase symporter family transporter [Candidatus Melainabacteria bacterium]
MPSLTAQIFIGLLLGGLIGVFLPEIGAQLQPLAGLFLRMIKMLIAPLLFATLVVGIAGSGDHKQLGRLGLKTILYFEIATTVALAIGLLVANTLKPGEGMNLELGRQAASELSQITANAAHVGEHTFVDTLLHMVPESVVAAMAQGEILQLVVFAVFFALAMIAAGDKAKPIMNVLESLSEVMFKFVGYVMAFAPLGVMGALAATIGKNGLGVLWIYAKLLGSLYFALGLFVLLVLVVVCQIIRVPFLKMLSAIKEPFLLAFSTASSESALPKAMTIMERFGVPKHVVAFVMPTGYSFNLDGSTLYLSLATLFVAQMAGISLSLEQQILILLTLMLTSKGVAAVPRASLVILAGTLTAFNLPVEGIAVILGIDHLLDMGRTSVNLIGNCVATAVVARWEGVLDDRKMLAFDQTDGDQTDGQTDHDASTEEETEAAAASSAGVLVPST